MYKILLIEDDIDLAKETFKLVKEPLTQKEIWEKANEYAITIYKYPFFLKY